MFHSCILTWLPAIFIWFHFLPVFLWWKKAPEMSLISRKNEDVQSWGTDVRGKRSHQNATPLLTILYRWFRQSSQNGHVKVRCDDMMQDTSCLYYSKSFIQVNCRSIHCLISASSFSLVSLGTLVPKGWRFSTWDLFCCFFLSAEVIKLHKNWEKQTINYNLPQVMHYVV